MRIGLLDAAIQSFNRAKELLGPDPSAASSLNANLEALQDHLGHAKKVGHGEREILESSFGTLTGALNTLPAFF
jgi:hypothetical protein